ncbi:hypothetical protein EDB86DRAFT_2953716, partial [Lactarius hatsudake]
MAVPGCPVSREWLLWLAASQAYLRRLSSALQDRVSGRHGSHVSSRCGSVPFKPTDDGCPWLSSWSVIDLLMAAVLGSPG